VTLSNTGNAALTIENILIDFGDVVAFNQTNNCGASVAAGANCAISVTFTPDWFGTLTSAVSIADNGYAGEQTIPLTGTGEPQATPPGSYQAGASGSYVQDVHNVSVSVNVQ
jgi:hypothetical protein